jgi:hypothetical protein
MLLADEFEKAAVRIGDLLLVPQGHGALVQFDDFIDVDQAKPRGVSTSAAVRAIRGRLVLRRTPQSGVAERWPHFWNKNGDSF